MVLTQAAGHSWISSIELDALNKYPPTWPVRTRLTPLRTCWAIEWLGSHQLPPPSFRQHRKPFRWGHRDREFSLLFVRHSTPLPWSHYCRYLLEQLDREDEGFLAVAVLVQDHAGDRGHRLRSDRPVVHRNGEPV